MPQMLDGILGRQSPGILRFLPILQMLPVAFVLLFHRRRAPMGVTSGGLAADRQRRPTERHLVCAPRSQSLRPRSEIR